MPAGRVIPKVHVEDDATSRALDALRNGVNATVKQSAQEVGALQTSLKAVQGARDVTGSRGGNAALASLLSALAAAGIIVDKTT
jgi:hypothetical protein